MPVMAQRPRFPLPLDPFFNCAVIATAPGGVYRAVLAIVAAYWRAGCSIPSRDDVTLAHLAKLPTSTLREHKSLILQALDEITPELDKAHERARTLFAGRQANFAGSKAKQAAKLAQQRLAEAAEAVRATLPVIQPTAPAHTPNLDLPAHLAENTLTHRGQRRQAAAAHIKSRSFTD
jgi:hypothetical protein